MSKILANFVILPADVALFLQKCVVAFISMIVTLYYFLFQPPSAIPLISNLMTIKENKGSGYGGYIQYIHIHTYKYIYI